MNESKTPRSDKAASRDYAPLSVPYEIACQIETDLFAARNAALSEGIARGQLETELAAERKRVGILDQENDRLNNEINASHARESQFREALERIKAVQRGDDWQARHSDSVVRLAAIHALVEGDADGTVDATDYEHLCNRIVGIITP